MNVSVNCYRMALEMPNPQRFPLIGESKEEDMLKQYNLKTYDGLSPVDMDTDTARSLKEFMVTGSPAWVKELYVHYGDGDTAVVIRAVDILVGRTVSAPERWVRKTGRALLAMIEDVS